MTSADNEILVLPIHQPYAWFYINGHKDVESRSRRIADKWIGQRVAVFVSKTKLTHRDYEDFAEECRKLKIKTFPQNRDEFDYGGVVGTVIVADIVDNSSSRWAIPGYQHYLLKAPRKLPLIPMKGQRTPWRIPKSQLKGL